MKKIISIIILATCVLSLCACTNSTQTKSTSSVPSTEATISQSEAENEAMLAVGRKLYDIPGKSAVYDIGATKFYIGKVTKTSNGYNVKGTYRLVDNYGKTRTESVKFEVNVSNSGDTDVIAYK